MKTMPRDPINPDLSPHANPPGDIAPGPASRDPDSNPAPIETPPAPEGVSDDQTLQPGVGETVRQRLMDAGEELFATKGFAETSIRDVTTAAECNIAAVNYYFNSKEKLYQAVFERHFETLREVRLQWIYKAMAQGAANLTLEAVVRAFAWGFLEPLLHPEKGPRLIRLMMREWIHPKLPAGMFWEQTIQPVRAAMVGAIRMACPELSEQDAVICVHSIVGQLVHHSIDLPTIQGQGAPAQAAMSHEQLDPVVEHVVRFSAAGIRAHAGRGDSNA